jgi:sugar phosphate isomerase/epimerase
MVKGADMTGERLLATCWTTAGDVSPMSVDPRSPLDLRDRVEAAAAAGFQGFGLLYADLVPALDEYGPKGFRALLDDNGMADLELELLTDWWTIGPARAESDRVRHGLLTAAETLGARHIKIAPDVTGAPWELDRWITEFATLAAQAADAGTKVGLEFLPWSNVKTVHDGLDIVQPVDNPAGGLLIDIWHTERGGTPPGELAAVPLRHIIGVELNDADADPIGTLFEDTVHRRRLCGEGTFDLAGFFAALRQAGWSGPWGVEILSDDHRAAPLEQAVAAAYTTARAIADR